MKFIYVLFLIVLLQKSHAGRKRNVANPATLKTSGRFAFQVFKSNQETQTLTKEDLEICRSGGHALFNQHFQDTDERNTVLLCLENVIKHNEGELTYNEFIRCRLATKFREARGGSATLQMAPPGQQAPPDNFGEGPSKRQRTQP
ncbi:uncharacterized protein LOC120354189 [Nilaparvata lugens]|uniref:uncharacterized protein LOC120354189 n=1 Tax=Nilaparvata lugens TaxID=108931 RepID=UPI00193CB6C3|nr:uncharacterized protein LOC120354189 [Nilaparvata lugens]